MSDHHETDPATLSIRAAPAEPRYEVSRHQLSFLKLLDALQHDDRPSFVIDIDAPLHIDNAPLELVYANPALTALGSLLEKVSGQHDADFHKKSSAPQLAFRSWAQGKINEHDMQRRGNTYVFEEYVWSAVTVDKYRIIGGLPTRMLWVDTAAGTDLSVTSKMQQLECLPSGQVAAPSIPPILKSPQPNSLGYSAPSTRTSSSVVKHGPFDYTLDSLSPANKPDAHIVYFRNVDWSATPLGPMTSWSADLRTTINAILNNSFPGVLFWGNEGIMIYNEAYVQLLGPLHPCMGKSIREEAPGYWASFEPLVKRINETGTSFAEHDMLLFIQRNGHLEETHWSFQFVPVLDQNGHVAAYFQSLYEITNHRILERRVTSLVDMGNQSANARSIQSFWDIALHSLTLNDKDIPFALLYAAERNNSDGRPTSPGSTQPLEICVLKGAIGPDTNHPIAPTSIDIHHDSYLFRPYLLEAARSRQATLVHVEHLDRSLLEDIQWKGYGDPCRTFVVCPILPTTGEAEGFLIVGTNPRSPFDDKYQQYIQVILRLLSTSLASIVLLEEEVRQREDAIVQAARIQEELLAELEQKEKKFQRFADRSDVAIFIADPMGNYTYRNQCWYDLFHICTAADSAQAAWSKIAFPEDIPVCEAVFRELVVDHKSTSFELRTTMPWTPPKDVDELEHDDTQHFTWILCSAYVELTAIGELAEIVGVVTNISRLKWAEGIQRKGRDNALESKQHLEHFIDTTSHEMRNPLSAILQCADGILSSLPDERHSPTPGGWSNFVEQTLDAAQTIGQCATHMRNIVNDILTVSKLDSGLLVITPVDTQPEDLVQHAVKMFDAEARAVGVELNLIIDESYHQCGIRWASLDPTRVLQVLINLLTNAIKFTRLEAKRQITVIMSASDTQPTSSPDGFQFQEEKLVPQSSQLEEDWKQGSDLFFLQFSVKDTGRGLSEDERGSLFARFSQASPRTHIHYGGSGLGLFISRRLTELQGGAIGLMSKPKQGSTFSFYIKTRRIKPALARKSSVPVIFPEDVRHRPETPLLAGNQPQQAPQLPALDSGQHGPEARDAREQTKVPNLTPTTGTKLRRTISIPTTLHVLVVEDNLVNQRVLAKQLRALGCVVSVANHGREALDFLPKTTYWNHNHPSSPALARRGSFHIPSTEPFPGMDDDIQPLELSLILMDWEMPIMNGLTAVAKIREMERNGVVNGRIPVIGVTANVRQQQIQTALTAGMDDVVGKPFRVAELLGRMRGLVAGVEEE